ncbi:MAG: AraC family transcriptional regulator [Lachnospiraceae bacterium]|nr:AraC family transcriptional regulator [Lachnospiraceae bacterium]
MTTDTESRTSYVSDPVARYRENSLFERREQVQPHASYAYEKLLLRVIAQGRTDQLEEVMRIPPDGTAGVLSKNTLRHHKNMFIAAITSYTRAAIDGGVSEELAYAMSDSFIMRAEECISEKEIQDLTARAAREFTEAVASKRRNRYSGRITAAIHYIEIHVHEKITLQDVADAVGFSPCHLSRMFKAETGLSFVEYVQRERIEAAKRMLLYSDDTLEAISEYLNFSSQSYFIRIFRKYERMTPGEYRRQHY